MIEPPLNGVKEVYANSRPAQRSLKQLGDLNLHRNNRPENN
jgi:hypothetical protein